MHLDSGDIADDFKDFATADGQEERPCARVDAQEQLDDEDEREDEEVESVADERGVVMYLGPGEGTCAKGAEGGVVV